jgi:hypothetical protein
MRGPLVLRYRKALRAAPFGCTNRATSLSRGKAAGMPLSIAAWTSGHREDVRMPDPWTEIEANRSDQGSDVEGAKWVITTGVALALVILLALLALKAS